MKLVCIIILCFSPFNFFGQLCSIDKPFHMGEFCTPGNMIIPCVDEIWTTGYFNNYDVSFHNELWASAFMGNFTTGLTWEWGTVHWWPDANPIKLTYGPGSGDYKDINNGLDETNELPMPNGQSDISFKNKKIYHNSKPLSDFIEQSEIDFSLNLTPMMKYNANNNTECYYLINSNKSKAYGWIHNLNHYWFNNYYYYFVDDGESHHYLSLDDDCDFPAVFYGDLLQGFDAGKSYTISFYPTRLNSSVVPPVTALINYNGALYIPAVVFDYNNFGCDTTNADFAFIITDDSGLKINGNNSETQYIINDASLVKNDFEKQNAITDVENDNKYFDVIITPNPSSDVFNIDISQYNISRIPTEILIYNALGNLLLYEQNITTLSVDLTDHPKGVYYLKVSINATVKYFKLILS